MSVRPPDSDEDVSRFISDLGIPALADIHVHFMPENVLAKVWAFFDHVADDGSETWGIHYRVSEDTRIATLRQLGVAAYPTLNYAHRPGMAGWLNDYSTAFAAAHPDVAVHSGTFFAEESAGEDARRALAAGAKIFKVHVQVGGFSPDDPLLEPAWEAVENAGLPVVMHCGSGPHGGEFTGPDPVRRLLDRHPGLTLVIAHAGMPEYREFTAMAREYPRVHLDTTMVGTDYMQRLFPIPADIRRSWNDMPEKIVLGTDFPNIPYEYAHQLRALVNLGFDDAWLRAVLWENGARLMGRPAVVP